MSSTLPGQANGEYGLTVNHAFLDFIGPLSGNVLDLGCGRGAWAPALRVQGAGCLIGIEPFAPSAAAARDTYDEVHEVTLERMPINVMASANLVIAADVLEHLLDPWEVLSKISRATASGTRLAISVPNVQNARFLASVAFKGEFRYQESGGFLDKGHLRWFTEASLREAVTATGWSVERSGGHALGRVARALKRLPSNHAHRLAHHQLHLLAVRAR